MAVLRPFYPCLLLLVATLVSLGSLSTAFQSPLKTNHLSKKAAAPSIQHEQPPLSIPAGSSSKRPLTLFHVKASKKTNVQEERTQQDWDFSLFLLYMTPWKNPNSIFVYMLLTLIGLGKYSESMAAARDAATAAGGM